MALSQRLEIRPGQSLAMTPQLMQAIKLLQLSNLDLAAYVEEELERNPLLERAGEQTESSAADRVMGATARSAVADRNEGSAQRRGTAADRRVADFDPRAELEAAGTRPDEAIRGYSEWTGRGAGTRHGGGYDLEALVPAETTLADHLAAQLALAVADPARRMIGRYLIDLVDESGYLTGDLSLLAEKLGAPLPELERVLAILQGFDPPGVCARNLAECLAIQLEERDRFDPAMQQLVAHLDLLARRDLAVLRTLCAVSQEDLADMIDEIRHLDPKPGLAFGSAPVQAIVPDVFVRSASDRSFVVELNADSLPKVLINQSYHAELANTARSKKDRSYLVDCLHNATWLVRALDQRARTILRVATQIVRQQDAFFSYGVRHLRPLNLKTIADAVDIHESTVSRVTANKYMSTDRGVFELKYFFTPAIAASDGGEAHSAEAVRHRIRQLIDCESADQVLSDETIMEKLLDAGIAISRRTVAKYRDAMRIPSSLQRRREKRSCFDAAS